MPSEKRQRQDEGRLARLEAQQVAQRKNQRKSQVRNLAILLAVLLVVAFGISVLSGGDDDDDAEVSTDSSSTTADDGSSTTAEDGSSSTAAEGAPIEVVLPGAGASITGETPCPAEDGSEERTTDFEQAPPSCIDEGVTYRATIETTEGDIVVELDEEAAPTAVNNFVVLARYHFYDNVPFHRIIPGFMIQGGDPVGPQPGTGGPGYAIDDELPTGDDPYPTGTLAMANSGPDTSGSQFFITVEGGGDQLTPDYTAFGTVVEGQDVVEAISQHGDAATNGTPTKVIAIERVTITEA